MDFQGDSLGQALAGGNTDIVIQLQSIANQLSALTEAFGGRIAFGSFTLAAAASLVIADSAVQGASFISFTPTNAAAATLMSSSEALYVSAISAGTSFTVATADGGSAAGTETFSYIIITPM